MGKVVTLISVMMILISLGAWKLCPDEPKIRMWAAFFFILGIVAVLLYGHSR